MNWHLDMLAVHCACLNGHQQLRLVNFNKLPNVSNSTPAIPVTASDSNSVADTVIKPSGPVHSSNKSTKGKSSKTCSIFGEPKPFKSNEIGADTAQKMGQ